MNRVRNDTETASSFIGVSTLLLGFHSSGKQIGSPKQNGEISNTTLHSWQDIYHN